MSTRTHKLVLVATGALAVALLPGTPAAADRGHDDDRGRGGDVLRADLIGSGPDSRNAVFAGKGPAGRPWVTDDGSRVRVRADGRIDVRIRGLVFGPDDLQTPGVNTVPTVVASLVCGDVIVDTTAPFALSTPGGDGRTRDHLDVPRRCKHPVVIIQGGTSSAGPRHLAFADGRDHHDDHHDDDRDHHDD